jgi:cytidylate kinase
MSTLETKITPKLESNFKFQVSKLDSGSHHTVHAEAKYPSITISREFGCEGYPLAHKLAELLSKHGIEWNIYNRDVFDQISESAELTEKLLEEIKAERRNQLQQYLDQMFANTPTELVRFKKLAQNIRAVTTKGHAIVVGAGGAIIGQDDKNQFHVRLIASMDFKMSRLRPLVPDLSITELIETIDHTNNKRVQFIKEFTSRDIKEEKYYDIVINNDRFSVDEMAELIIAGMKIRGLVH